MCSVSTRPPCSSRNSVVGLSTREPTASSRAPHAGRCKHPEAMKRKAMEKVERAAAREADANMLRSTTIRVPATGSLVGLIVSQVEKGHPGGRAGINLWTASMAACQSRSCWELQQSKDI